MIKDIDRLKEIQDDIDQLLEEAKGIIIPIVRQHKREIIWDRAKGYWYAHIVSALFKETEFLGGSMTTMEDTINELENLENDEEED